MTAIVKTQKESVRIESSKTPKLDVAKYGQLLAEAVPTVITTEAEYDRVVAMMDKLAVLTEKQITPEQDRLLDLLTLLVEKYDEEHYQIPDAEPHEIIQYLMQEHGLRNKDLEPVLGSRGVTSEVISGKRKPSKTQIKNLAEFFSATPDLFYSFD
ncbi:MAG: transcriptional regulator [Acidobacteriota bacterium]